MTQADLDRQIAHRTGENVSTIRGMGFVPLMHLPYEREPRPQVVDWDRLDEQRVGLFPNRPSRQPAFT